MVGGASSQQGRSGSQQFQGGEDASQPCRGCHQFKYFFHSICTNLFTCVFFNIQNFIYVDVEAENAPNGGQNRRGVERYIQEEGGLPTTTYPADISDIQWERNMAQCTL